MVGFLEKRMQKALEKVSKKIKLDEADLVAVTREIKMALLEADVNLQVVKEFIKNVKQKVLDQELIGKLNPSQQFIKILHEELVSILGNKVQEFKIEKKPYIIMMCGLQGSGKTTATAKLAYYFRKKKHIQKPLVVAADIYRPAAVEQLVTLAKSIQADFYEQGVNNPVSEIVANALKHAKENDNDLIILDTAGRLSIDEPLMNELQEVKKIAHPDEIFFVADSLSGQDIINVAKTFHEKLKLTGSIITKLDSDARGGAAFSLRYILNLPIRFTGTGEKIGNLDLFYPERMADRILGMGDVMSLIEHAQDNIDQDKMTNMVKKILSGSFTLDDLMEQIKQVKNLGKFSKILKMLPGNLSSRVNEDQVEKAEEKMRVFQILISSMTKKERNNPRLLRQASRKERILKGSGRTPQEFNKLLSDFDSMVKQMSEMAKSFKKTGGFGGFGF
ncbi:signal recognition particle protein [Mycoplasma sp. CSL10137]|uniref:signal recognition particle protein n=1 Tax=unclassified Mycoplasma TaxID=2683645 RepID=UPI00197BC02F|nr:MULTISPECIES: signal recognition particle protein [unclassified Mycoplasma]MBN4083776.1 signal recognition particle protein [Mycoplasma sp. CSL10137]MBN4084180.1 signal recognition particle protein [Mycoplasma sp. CSL10166]MBU4692643.1 signal recognition particle protein [Mycoplasma sp. CSL7491-lung]MCU4706367.1 signal recognition particle protein [Mycoplasma sp. CSL7503-lung]